MSTFKYYKNGQWNTVNGAVTGDTVPIGAITEYGGTTAPANWLICDGSAVSRTTYASLFAVLGTYFGAGDGSTTFNLPDLRGRVPVGKSTDAEFDTLGEKGGSKDAVLVSHKHELGYNTSLLIAGGQQYGNVGSGNTLGQGWYTASTGESGTGKNLQPYQVVNYIIKAFQSSGVVAGVSNTQSSSQTDAYSCDYINDMITPTSINKNIVIEDTNVALKDLTDKYLNPYSKSVDANGWTKIDFGKYQEYYKNGHWTYNYGGNAWGNISFAGTYATLPNGITFDNSKMSFCGTVACQDAAIVHNVYIANGSTSISVTYQNKYDSSVNNARSDFHYVLRVYQ